MYEHVELPRQIVVDDRAEVVDVETARGHIRGHHDTQASVAEKQQHRIAIVLFHAAVKRHRGKPRRREPVGDLIACLAVIAKHDRGDGAMVTEDPDQRGQSLGSRDVVHHLRDPRSDVLRGNDHVQRTRDRADGIDEPHVEHSIRFVEYERANAQQIEPHALQMVMNTPRRADNHVGAVLERRSLSAPSSRRSA
jgi:hypothetical protein